MGTASWAAAALVLMFGVACAQVHAQAPKRTVEEIKTEAQARAERGNYPLIGLDPADVRDALTAIHTRDPDEWAAGWSRVADRTMADAAAHPDRADADRLRAWRLYHFAQWPVPSSPGKQAPCCRASPR